MSSKRETRSVGATTERATGEKTTCRASISIDNLITADTSRQPLRVADYLNVGEAGAVPMRHLKGVLRLDSRTIRRMITEERRRGTLILSNNKSGYYIAGNSAEVAQFVKSMRARAFEIQRIASIIQIAGLGAGHE